MDADEKVIADAGIEIRRKQNSALTNILCLLATPIKFETSLEFCYVLGKFFSLQLQTGGFQSDKIVVRNEEVTEEKLRELLDEICFSMKGNLISFLLGAMREVSYNDTVKIAEEGE